MLITPDPWRCNLVMLLFGPVAFGIPFVLTLYAQQVVGYSALKFGVGSVVLAIAATVAVGAIVAQAVVLKVGLRPVAATGMALMGVGLLRGLPGGGQGRSGSDKRTGGRV